MRRFQWTLFEDELLQISGLQNSMNFIGGYTKLWTLKLKQILGFNYVYEKTHGTVKTDQWT